MAQNRELVIVSGKPVRATSVNALKSAPQRDWRVLVATFIASQDVRESSRLLYTRTLTQFFRWIEAQGKNLSQLNREDILEYKDSLLSSGLSALTISSYIVAVRKFYEWSEALLLYPNIAKGIKTPEYRIKKKLMLWVHGLRIKEV